MGDEHKRQYQRALQAFDAQYRVAGGLTETWRRVTTLDLSASGMRFESQEPLEQGMMLDICLVIPSDKVPVHLKGEIMRCLPASGGGSENGVQFIDVKPAAARQIDELVEFLAKSQPPPQADQS